MSDEPTPVHLPAHLPYPITITRLLQSPSAAITRGTPLLEYSFTSDTARRAIARRDRERHEGKPASKEGKEDKEEEAKENDLVGSWESGVDGEVVRWGDNVTPGLKLDRRLASNKPIILIQQPCSHPVQLHGLCGVCGKELTETDYLTAPSSMSDNAAGPSRFPGAYEMGHDALGVTVSSNEARRLDNQARTELLRSRRLSLIVDLDQTIIHTTVDPTVGEWLSEIAADAEADIGGDSNAEDMASAADGTRRPGLKGKQKERNPNEEALKDVAAFQLEDEAPGPQVGRKGRGRAKPPERWPGLRKFLEDMSKLYEMHVYTMGTRNYADAVCAAIDPGGHIFGGRILSRDESGSFSSKNLKRLFPTDQSMVVVIDDRSDVWGDIPNLVKVIPYDFFLGIGDINSPVGAAPHSPPASPPASSPPLSTDPGSSTSPSADSDLSTPPPLTPEQQVSEEDEAERKTARLDKVEEERPLARLQAELERNDQQLPDADAAKAARDEGGTSDGVSAAEGADLGTKVKGDDGMEVDAPDDAKGSETTANISSSTEGSLRGKRSTTPEAPPPHKRKQILNPHDYELDRISKILKDIHHSFYRAYDARPPGGDGGDEILPMGCDLIIPDLKSRVFDGCSFIFSGVIPRHIPPPESAIWLTALTFGARPLAAFHASATHCVTAALGTEKTYKARKAGKWVVWAGWFWQSVAEWRRVDEVQWDCFPNNTARGGDGDGDGEGKTPAGSGTSTPAPGLLTVHGRDRDEDNAERSRELHQDSNSPSSPRAEQGLSSTEQPEVEDESVNDGGGAGTMEFDVDAADEGFALGAGWDEEAEKEFEAFLADGTDEAGSMRSRASSPAQSVPGTPRKRVRYADEEDLPLESFREPMSWHGSPSGGVSSESETNGEESPEEGDGSVGRSPPRKRKKAIILLGPPAPAEEQGEVSGEGEEGGARRQVHMSSKVRERMERQIQAAATISADEENARLSGSDGRDDEGSGDKSGPASGSAGEDMDAESGGDEMDGRSSEGGGDDEFARMTIDIARAELSKAQATGDPQLDSNDAPSVDAFGNQGQPGQYAQLGQHGAVTGAGFGGGLAKDAQGQPVQQGQGQGQGGERRHRPSVYEGMEQDDSTATGGYGKNKQGSSFSRANQMGADNSAAVFGDDDDDDHAGYKTGTSTPGYRQEGDVDAQAAENRMRNQNFNVYGKQSDDRGAKGNDYNEAEEPQI